MNMKTAPEAGLILYYRFIPSLLVPLLSVSFNQVLNQSSSWDNNPRNMEHWATSMVLRLKTLSKPEPINEQRKFIERLSMYLS